MWDAAAPSPLILRLWSIRAAVALLCHLQHTWAVPCSESRSLAPKSECFQSQRMEGEMYRRCKDVLAPPVSAEHLFGCLLHQGENPVSPSIPDPLPLGDAFLVPATKIFPNPGSSQTYTHIFLCYSHWLVPSVWPNAWTAFLANL